MGDEQNSAEIPMSGDPDQGPQTQAQAPGDEPDQQQLNFTRSHLQNVRKAHKFITRCSMKAQPESYSWHETLRSDISARWGLLQHALSNSVVSNQLIRIPTLFSLEYSKADC
jgi:hypothetical protein